MTFGFFRIYLKSFQREEVAVCLRADILQGKVGAPQVRAHVDVDGIGFKPRVRVYVPHIRAHDQRYSVEEHLIGVLLGRALTQHHRRAARLENLPISQNELLSAFVEDDALMEPSVELLAVSRCAFCL